MGSNFQKQDDGLLFQQSNDSNQAGLLFNKRIWNIDDVVEVTGYSKSYIYELVHKDKIPRLPKKKKRGKLLFDPEEVFNWIHEGDF